MEKIYNHEIVRINKALLFEKNQSSLFKLKPEQIQKISKQQLVEMFCRDLRSLLEIDNLVEIIKRIDSLEFHLESLREESASEFKDSKIPHLDDFFKALSPVLMRAMVESIESEEGRDALYKGWKEALRIAVEEEIQIWQEKII